MSTSGPAGDSAGDLLRAARAGDKDAWTDLVAQHTGLIWSIARSFRLSRVAADDVVQTVWLRLLEKGGTIRDPDAVTSWLATTARRECLAAYRRAPEEVCDDRLPDLVEGRQPEEIHLRSDRDRVLWEALERLPERDRMLLRVLAGGSRYDDVSAALEMPRGSIGPTRARALQRLRAELHRAGVESLTDVL
jgi:RNA polymerase sigma factor (sigma-70 family)